MEQCPNQHVGALKRHPWNEILRLLGGDGDRIMLEMLLHQGLFIALEYGKSNFFQLSGILAVAQRLNVLLTMYTKERR